MVNVAYNFVEKAQTFKFELFKNDGEIFTVNSHSKSILSSVVNAFKQIISCIIWKVFI
jgi:hypothetical protein